MYCIKCGVNLSEGQKKCPLCDTVVYHPDITNHIPGTYPIPKKDSVKLTSTGFLTIISLIFSIVCILVLFIDFQINKGITWSGYVTNSIILLYVWIALPFWIKRSNPVIYIPINLFATALYLSYINYSLKAHWFLTFALPIIILLAIILTILVFLLRYLRKGYLFITSGVWFALGGFIMTLELLLNYTFGISDTLVWSPYPFATCGLLGLAFVVIAINQPLREFLHKRFFI